MHTTKGVCPHVAVIVNGDALIFENGQQVGIMYLGGEDLDVLTDIGSIDGGRVYFSPNPAIYVQAIEQSAVTGIPVSEIYVAMFRALGMEHDNWHERRDTRKEVTQRPL